jgi:hypothetical protein
LLHFLATLNNLELFSSLVKFDINAMLADHILLRWSEFLVALLELLTCSIGFLCLWLTSMLTFSRQGLRCYRSLPCLCLQADQDAELARSMHELEEEEEKRGIAGDGLGLSGIEQADVLNAEVLCVRVCVCVCERERERERERESVCVCVLVL